MFDATPMLNENIGVFNFMLLEFLVLFVICLKKIKMEKFAYCIMNKQTESLEIETMRFSKKEAIKVFVDLRSGVSQQSWKVYTNRYQAVKIDLKLLTQTEKSPQSFENELTNIFRVQGTPIIKKEKIVFLSDVAKPLGTKVNLCGKKFEIKICDTVKNDNSEVVFFCITLERKK